jgi:hypothetical protein
MARRRSGTRTRNLVVISDTHSGCRLGLYPWAARIRVDDGGFYVPSEFQQQVWQFWREFWDTWVPEATNGEPFDLVHNGDAIDGVHHNSTTQISHNTKDQKKIAVAAIKPEVDRCLKMGGTYYHIRGTEAHVGKSGVYEEELAEELGAKPNAQGQHARYDLWKRVGGSDGPLVHLLHHIGTTSSSARETSAVNAELAAEFNEAAQWGRVPPDIIVRSHRHRYSAIELPTKRGRATAVVTPCWQGKTPFAWKIAGARLTEPQFGGLVIRYNDEGVFYVRSFVKSMDRSPEE